VFAHEFPCATIPGRRCGNCIARPLSSNPPHDARKDSLQFLDVFDAVASATDAPQPAGTYTFIGASLSCVVFVGGGFFPAVFEEGDEQ